MFLVLIQPAPPLACLPALQLYRIIFSICPLPVSTLTNQHDVREGRCACVTYEHRCSIADEFFETIDAWGTGADSQAEQSLARYRNPGLGAL